MDQFLTVTLVVTSSVESLRIREIIEEGVLLARPEADEDELQVHAKDYLLDYVLMEKIREHKTKFGKTVGSSGDKNTCPLC